MNIPPPQPHLAPGSPFPQGASWDGKGVNFALFSEGAEAVDLCLYGTGEETREMDRIPLQQRTTGIWHCYLPDLRPGQLYGYRVHGDYNPANGQRFNYNKLLLDPYAKGIGRKLTWDKSLFGYEIGHKDEDLSFSKSDSSAFAPLGCVVDETFDWGDDARPRRPWHETIIYESHVRGLTKRHPGIPEEMRGTYSAMASEPILKHLTQLGVTAIELMPVHHFLDDSYLVDKKLSNYWGYNTLGFFAPEPRYGMRKTPHGWVREFKEMVKKFHQAGIEVILDVVYNHTAEGNHLGPTLSFRGIDNAAYYRTVEGDQRYYMDYTGCGNTLNMMHPHCVRLLMDSLRYWVSEMHVDGFRFDLASALARELHEVNQLGVFFDTIYQDPVLAVTKLIAEPWDLGEGGYQVGNFPVNWTEWNGMYRDSVRRFWKGEEGIGEAATRLAGSADLYEATRRKPSASINFITAHDGFTLRDLVSHNEKHNSANHENNNDGANDNHSWNCGVEGETDNEEVNKLRAQQQRNLLATLFFSQGVPMISGGDEISRSQGGNNNGFCQDNELSWHNWELNSEQADLLKFTKHIADIRTKHPNLRRHSYYEGDPLAGPLESSLDWVRPDGARLTDEDWREESAKCLCLFLNGNAAEIRDSQGHPTPDDDFLIILNAHHEATEMILPDDLQRPWTLLVDTAATSPPSEHEVKFPLQINPRTLLLLRHAR